jgi:Tol biopolymer transport system component/polyisoprenoid-binding protein YceI
MRFWFRGRWVAALAVNGVHRTTGVVLLEPWWRCGCMRSVDHRCHRRRRWCPLLRLGLVVAIVVGLLAAGGWLWLAGRDAPPAARLRPGSGAGGIGRPDGEWVVARTDDSFVGYRIRERLGAISAPNDVVGRSHNISGTILIAGGTVTAAQVTVDMITLRTDMEPRDGRMRDDGLETPRFPTATFKLTRPVLLGDVSGGRVVSLEVPGELTLHGVTRPVVFPLQARWDGAAIQVAGSLPVKRADFDLQIPSLAGFRIQDQGVVELELTLIRKGGALAGPVSTLARHVAIPKARHGEPGGPQGRPCRGGRPLASGGGRLLFAALTDDDVEHLYTIGGDGRGLRRLGRDSAFEMQPSWSPDGRRITFTRAEDDPNAPPPSVNVARADGADRKELGPGAMPDWSPDGRRIAFMSEAGGDGTGMISVMSTDGSGTRQFDQTPTSDGEPRWSPDGRRIAVSAYGGTSNDDIAVIDVHSGRFRRLTRAPGYEHSPAWSPDGRRIAYVKDGAIHVMGADGSGDRALTRGRKDTAPAWSPDGRRLSWVRDGNLYLAHADRSRAACMRVGMLLTSGARWQPGRYRRA